MSQATTEIVPLFPGNPQHERLVRDFHARVTAADGLAPLSDQCLIDWQRGRSSLHALIRADASTCSESTAQHLLGVYVLTEPHAAQPALELSITPDARGHGLGALLLDHALSHRGPHGSHPQLESRELRVWAHGDTPASRKLARRHDFRPVRTLHHMRASVPADRPSRGELLRSGEAPGAGTSIRPFVIGRDEEEWLALNARIFASHPEQGSLTMEDLRLRMAEPWFDPEEFLLLFETGAMIGFAWLKPPTELYVLGVALEAAGRGLGRLLVEVGFERFRGRGIPTIELYVDDDNPAALALYRACGFTINRSSVQYAKS